jgi:hypothetical protein
MELGWDLRMEKKRVRPRAK